MRAGPLASALAGVPCDVFICEACAVDILTWAALGPSPAEWGRCSLPHQVVARVTQHSSGPSVRVWWAECRRSSPSDGTSISSSCGLVANCQTSRTLFSSTPPFWGPPTLTTLFCPWPSSLLLKYAPPPTLLSSVCWPSATPLLPRGTCLWF